MSIRFRALPGVLLAATLAIPAFAAPPQTATSTARTPTAQQQRMSDCSHQNKGKTGADYKAAQKTCLSGQATTAAGKTTQQQKMAHCSQQSKGRKGDDYKTAMSTCLKS